MASAGFSLITTPLNSSLCAKICVSSNQEASYQTSSAQSGALLHCNSICQSEFMGAQLSWRVNGIPASSVSVEALRIRNGGNQTSKARAFMESGFLQPSNMMDRRLIRNSSSTDLEEQIKLTVARAGMNVAYEFEDAFGSLSLPLPPEPVLFPRKMLNLKFAVLLMRSAYEAVDALDFIPMDKFQIKFWKLRQSEVEPYTLQCRPLRIKYGDLTDPLYFDFISFSQFATISNEMRTGEMIFQEKLGSDGQLRTVRRDERLKDNNALPPAFVDKAGKLLYEKLLEGFEGEVFDAPPPSSPDYLSAMNGVRKLLKVFVDKGYALKASVEPVQFSANKPGGKLRVRLEGSATQWGCEPSPVDVPFS